MQHKQQGSVLIICLLFMMLITMLALNSARTASFEQRMAHGARDLHTAFQATESALGGGEGWLENRTSRPIPEPASSGCTAPCDLWVLYAQGDFPDTATKTAAWWATNGRAPTETLTVVNTQPRYLIEEQQFAPDSLTVGIGVPAGRWFYRVTSRGTGGTDDAEVLLQTSYVRRF
jgi:type IV pilus assembly protein PilX